VKCLIASSYYGLILINEQNEIEWEITYKENNLYVDHKLLPTHSNTIRLVSRFIIDTLSYFADETMIFLSGV